MATKRNQAFGAGLAYGQQTTVFPGKGFRERLRGVSVNRAGYESYFMSSFQASPRKWPYFYFILILFSLHFLNKIKMAPWDYLEIIDDSQARSMA